MESAQQDGLAESIGQAICQTVAIVMDVPCFRIRPVVRGLGEATGAVLKAEFRSELPKSDTSAADPAVNVGLSRSGGFCRSQRFRFDRTSLAPSSSEASHHHDSVDLPAAISSSTGHCGGASMPGFVFSEFVSAVSPFNATLAN